MKTYKSIPIDRAYRLINHGPLVLVSTRSGNGRFNIAPIAWNCPVGMEPCQVLLAIEPGHQTFRNIAQTREFIVGVPGRDQAGLVREAGSVSGAKMDKFERFRIDAFFGERVRAKIPQGTLAFLECRLIRTIKLDEVALTIGRCVSASVLARGFSGRLLVERAGMKTLHHLGGQTFALPGNRTV